MRTPGPCGFMLYLPHPRKQAAIGVRHPDFEVAILGVAGGDPPGIDGRPSQSAFSRDSRHNLDNQAGRRKWGVRDPL